MTNPNRDVDAHWFDPERRESNVQLLKNLVVMAMADGQLSEREANLVHKRCEELGLADDDFLEALKSGLRDDASLNVPSDPAQRELLMQDLIRMMTADGKIEEGEKRLLVLAAAKMQISATRLTQMLAADDSVSKSVNVKPPNRG